MWSVCSFDSSIYGHSYNIRWSAQPLYMVETQVAWHSVSNMCVCQTCKHCEHLILFTGSSVILWLRNVICLKFDKSFTECITGGLYCNLPMKFRVTQILCTCQTQKVLGKYFQMYMEVAWLAFWCCCTYCMYIQGGFSADCSHYSLVAADARFGRDSSGKYWSIPLASTWWTFPAEVNQYCWWWDV